ncbi:hypothetical protein L6250_02595 [Candidatus Parcubacteria bacterium]|nr:hypothetical protein [Patescibacteria group bacterium]MCG2688499.1 hypothetical protein [Candidatus Parcubacteria bacterium]
MLGTAIVVYAGLTIGNFIYAAFKKQKDWGEAAKISFFQAIALSVFMFFMAIK